MEIKVLSGQSLPDIAVQSAGSIEALLDMAIANDVSVSDPLTAGRQIVVPGHENRQVADWYAANNHHPATGKTPTDVPYGGIEYMAIEVDFIVS